MYIPPGFPASAQAQVEGARLKAIRELDAARKVAPPNSWTESQWDLCAFYAYIIEIFHTFGREACELGAQGTWTVAHVRSEVDEFLRMLISEERYERGRDRHGRKFREMVSNIDGSLLPDVKEKIRQSDEWRQFETDLLAIAERQAEKNPKPGAPVESIMGRLSKGGFQEGKQAGAAETSVNEPTRTDAGPADNEANGSGAGRHAAVNAFMSKVLSRTGRKIARRQIWTAAGYKTATEFERFQRGDIRATKGATEVFNRFLNMKPEDFIALLDKKSVSR
jgi:hypothetical protein